MAPSGVGVSEYTAMECGKVHGLGELLEERGEGDCRHFRGGSAAISANSGEALYRPGKSRIRVDSVYYIRLYSCELTFVPDHHRSSLFFSPAPPNLQEII